METKEIKFEYQRFIADNNISMAEVPEILAQMIELVDDHLAEVHKECTDGHCQIVHKDLQNYADFILDELFLYYDNQIKDNIIQKDDLTIDRDEFNTLLNLITPENGDYQKTVRGKLQSYTLFYPWLKHAFRLVFETGLRPNDVINLKWSHVYMDKKVIALTLEKSRRSRVISVGPDLENLLLDIRDSQGEDLTGYLIAPELEKREPLRNLMSGAFKHFWKLTGNPKKVFLKHLRLTYLEARKSNNSSSLLEPDELQHSDEAILQEFLDSMREYATYHELKSKGFKTSLEDRYIRVGKFMLMHEFRSPRYWITRHEDIRG